MSTNQIFPVIRSAYSPRVRISISFPEQGRTKQSFKDECDINNILSKYQRTGVLDFVNNKAPMYADVVGFDFQAGMETIIRAQEMFAGLPSTVRKRFDNDPGVFLEFMENPENLEEAVKLGLREAPAANPLGEPKPASEARTTPPDAS